MDVEFMSDVPTFFVRLMLLQSDMYVSEILEYLADNDLILSRDELIDILAEYGLCIDANDCINIQ